MKNPVRTLSALIILASAALVAQAQPAPKIAVVDVAKLFNGHYRTEEQNAKIKVDEEKAMAELDRLNGEDNALVAQYQEFAEQVNNPATTNEAKAKAQQSAQQKGAEIQQKRNEIQNYRASTSRFFQQRIQSFQQMMIEDITKITTDIAKKKGATLLFDKSGPSTLGLPSVMFADAAYDITEEALVEINKNRPAPVAAPAVAPAAAAPAAAKPATAGEPKITVPGAKK